MIQSSTESTPAHRALAAARRWRLPFSRHAWRGYAGNWLASGAGSSLDFHDHRDYAPGDDPRHIHWQAYARTGSLTMKLYRAEVAPFVDIVVDLSHSMEVTPEKSARTQDLLAFCVASADRAAAPCRIHGIAGSRLVAISPPEVRAGSWRPPFQSASDHAPPGPIAWRHGAMKILISDLLFPGDPTRVANPLGGGSGVPIVLAPALQSEATLQPRGNVELVDCESGRRRRQAVDDALAGRYAAAYERHFQLWRDACSRRGVLLARIPCEGDLAAALSGEASLAGAVEAAG